jgi:class 3 adenylate cyclase/tetratricopeptide (TPR) repeat protein
MDRVGDWLARLGLEQYTAVFADNHVDREVLPDLTDADLEKLGVTLGHRKKMMKAIAALRSGVEPARGISDQSPADQSKGGDAERRQLTVMFCDLVGSTALSEHLDPEQLRELLARYQDACAAVIDRYGGHIARYVGDGLLIYFGYPHSFEDNAARAVRAALGIVGAVGDLDTGVELSGAALAVRIGVTTGEVVVGDIGQGERREKMAVVGQTPNLAARLQGLAGAGEIIVDATTRRLTDSAVDHLDLGLHDLKGFSDPIRAWRVTAARPFRHRFAVSLGRGLSRLAGRDRELQTLRACWHNACSGHLVVVDVAGDPGIGKSRLVHEFRQGLGEEPVLVEGYCQADGQHTAFLPFIDVVRQAFHVDRQQPSATVLTALRQGAGRYGLSVDQHLPYLENLLGLAGEVSLEGLDAEVVGIRTRQSLLALLRGLSKLAPTLLVIEDLHWMDRASQGLLRELVRADESPALLVITTYRSDYRPPWSASEQVVSITLGPLSRQEIAALSSDRLRTGGVPERLVDILEERSQGNPLFVEEVASHLLESGQLQIGEAGIGLHLEGERASIPTTLAGLLLERVDRLAHEQRALLQFASVIGRTFSPELLAEVSAQGDKVAERLRELERQDLLCPAAGNRYVFRHVLVQEAVYDSMLTVERERLHGLVGRTIEGLYAGRLAEVADELAYHFSRTGDLDRKLRYLRLAGEKSQRLYSIESAHRRFRQALDLAEANPGKAGDAYVCDLVLSLSRIHYFEGDFGAITRLTEEYLPVFEGLGDASRLARCLAELGYSQVFAARSEVGRPLLERVLEMGREHGDPAAIGYAAVGLAWYHMAWEPPSARQDENVQRYSALAWDKAFDIGDVWLQTKALYVRAIHAVLRGRQQELNGQAERLMQLAEDTNDTRPRVTCLTALAYMDALSGATDAALAKVDECLGLALSPFDRTNALGAKGAALTTAGRAAEAKPVLEKVRDRHLAGEALLPLNTLDASYGAVCVQLGEVARGIDICERMIRNCQERNSPLWAAIGDLVLGGIYLQMTLDGVRPTPVGRLNGLRLRLLIRPQAARRAQRHLARAERVFRLVSPSALLATTNLCLGQLALHRGRPREGRAWLDAALAEARAAGAESLSATIEATRAAE